MTTNYTLIIVFIATFFISCSTHIHTVGQGARGSNSQEARQWYAVWGLVPINNAQSGNMVPSNVTNYEIKTEQSFIDVLINMFTGFVTVYSRTVQVNY